jgi:signal transduction histidine kinase
LNSVINYLEVALEEVLDENARQHLQRSLQASKSLVFVVNDLLNLTEAESSEVSIHEDDVDLRSLVDEVATAYSHESMAKFVNVQLDIDETVPKLVRCDRGGLRQVLSNLLDNAIRQQGQGIVKVSLLQISYTDTDSVIEVAFEDEGGGLSELELDKMFQEFEHILDDDDDDYHLPVQPEEEKQLKGRQVSIGLGLAITAIFVKLNNGQVSIASELGKVLKLPSRSHFKRLFSIA